MKKYTVTKTVTLTVEPGSVVVVCDEQYKLVPGHLKPMEPGEATPKAVKSNKK